VRNRFARASWHELAEDARLDDENAQGSLKFFARDSADTTGPQRTKMVPNSW
jgi:hypothetical protein